MPSPESCGHCVISPKSSRWPSRSRSRAGSNCCRKIGPIDRDLDLAPTLHSAIQPRMTTCVWSRPSSPWVAWPSGIGKTGRPGAWCTDTLASGNDSSLAGWCRRVPRAHYAHLESPSGTFGFVTFAMSPPWEGYSREGPSTASTRRCRQWPPATTARTKRHGRRWGSPSSRTGAASLYLPGR